MDSKNCPCHCQLRQLRYGIEQKLLGILTENSISITCNVCLGGLHLGLGAKGDRLRHWASLIKHPNQVHKRTHALSANFIN
jgi:hypothetical protein